METILNYNFDFKDIEDMNFAALFEKRRRDSIFASAFEKDGCHWLIRDHLGIVPLFYSNSGRQLRASTNIKDLIDKSDAVELDRRGLLSYLGFGTTKLISPFKDIKIVPPGSVIKVEKTGEVSLVYRYKIKPQNLSFLRSFDSLVNILDKIFYTSIERQIKNRRAALCLSGGIDSGLIGIYLKKMGIRVSAFVSATRGADEEMEFFKKNCGVIRPDEVCVDELNQSYENLAELLVDTYKQPFGNITGLAMTSLWNNTEIKKHAQIFFGQNSDVIHSAMDNDKIPIFGLLPKKLRAVLNQKSSQVFDRYTREMSGNLLDKDPVNLSQVYNVNEYANHQLCTIAGMYIKRTPVDSELLAQPAINSNVVVSNPYYDMDLVEFAIGTPIRHKMTWKRNHLSLDKRLLQSLALKKGLPKNLVYRKKGFTVSKKIGIAADFFSRIPSNFGDIELHNDDQRFAAFILDRFAKTHNLKMLD